MFNLNEKQLIELEEWNKEHNKICPFYKNTGAIGGRLTYCFTPTSLGVIVEVKCACGKKIGITEYEDW